MSLNATWIIVTEYCSANVCRGNVKQAGPETSRMLTVIITIIIISIIILIIITIIYLLRAGSVGQHRTSKKGKKLKYGIRVLKWKWEQWDDVWSTFWWLVVERTLSTRAFQMDRMTTGNAPSLSVVLFH